MRSMEARIEALERALGRGDCICRSIEPTVCMIVDLRLWESHEHLPPRDKCVMCPVHGSARQTIWLLPEGSEDL